MNGKAWPMPKDTLHSPMCELAGCQNLLWVRYRGAATTKHCSRAHAYAVVRAERVAGKRSTVYKVRKRLADKTCPQCKQSFHPRYADQKFCKGACGLLAIAPPIVYRPCARAGCHNWLKLVGHRAARKTCGRACGIAYSAEQKPLKPKPTHCRTCKKAFDSRLQFNKNPDKHRPLWHQWCNPCMRDKAILKDAARVSYNEHYANNGEASMPKAAYMAMHALPCHHCGIVKAKRGIDRIDSSKGYVPGNMQPSCWDHNRMKSNLPDARLVAMCAEVVRHARKKAKAHGQTSQNHSPRFRRGTPPLPGLQQWLY